MPRVSQSSTNRTSSSDPLIGPHPNVLKRNQVCCYRSPLVTFHLLISLHRHATRYPLILSFEAVSANSSGPVSPTETSKSRSALLVLISNSKYTVFCRNGIIEPALPCMTIIKTSHSDAKRPCSTCVRSHAHAVAHAPPGTNLPARPECTFDDGLYCISVVTKVCPNHFPVAENTIIPSDGPKSKYEKLENRISAFSTE
jgi:hypothetical protein